MKRFLLILALMVMTSISFTTDAKIGSVKESRIEVVNEQTVIFKNVIKIEIRTNKENQLTYVYDLRHSKLMAVEKGAFEVELPMGDYLVQSSEKITKTSYEFLSLE